MNKTIRDPIFEEIDKERRYQQDKWGNGADDAKNTPWHFTAYISQYVGKWMAGTWAPLQSDTVTAFRTAMVKVAAIAVAAIESVDRQRAATGKTFYEG